MFLRMLNSNAKEKATKENNEKATRKHEKGKRKGTSSKDYCIPKKVRSEKSCALCQKHGDAHTTHNTGECCKYEKDGALKKSFNGKAAIGTKYNGKGVTISLEGRLVKDCNLNQRIAKRLDTGVNS